MNKNLQKQRMNIELNQIRSILNDFRKTKYKCADMAASMAIEMPKEEHFKNIQKATLRKMDLLDITGLVNLKNQLVRALTQLFQLERQLRYKKQKFQARKQIMEVQKEEMQYIKKNQAESAVQSPIVNKPQVVEQNFKSILIETKKQEPLVEQKQKNKNLEIPLYRAKNETNQNKLDRISKYIASLKRNMKLNSQTLGYKWKIKEFLLQDQNYLKLRTQLQMFMMREEEIDSLFCKAFQKGIKDHLRKAQIVQSNQDYKLIKIYKPLPNKNNSQPSQTHVSNLEGKNAFLKNSNDNVFVERAFLSDNKGRISNQQLLENNFDMFNSPKFQQQKANSSKCISSFNSPTKEFKEEAERPNEFKKIKDQQFKVQRRYISPLKQLQAKIEVKEIVEQDFKPIKKQLEKSNQTFMQMLSKLTSTVEKGSQKLIEMREKRKKRLEKNTDIWDELDKI